MREQNGRIDEPSVPSRHALELFAIDVAQRAAELVREAFGSATQLGTKSSATDVVTQTDVDSEALIRSLLLAHTPDCGILGEEGEALNPTSRLQWVIDPLDGTINFLYGVPLFAISIGAALDGEFVAGAVVDVLRGETFSAHRGGGARKDGIAQHVSTCDQFARALIVTGFSYIPRLREKQGAIVHGLLPEVRDVRCFGSAALHLCWLASGRIDGYFERDIKIWDWAAGSIIAEEAGATFEGPCPENDGLVLCATPSIFHDLRAATA